MSRVIDVLRTRAVYLTLLAITPVVQVFVYAFNPGVPVFKGHSLGVVAFYGCLLLAALAWLPFHRTGVLPGIVSTFLLTALAGWLYAVVRTQLDQSTFEIVAFGVPLALLMILSKPPSRRDVSTAMLALAYAIVAVSAASAILIPLGLMTDGTPNTPEFEGRIAVFGLHFARWAGPFGNPNYLSPLASFVIVYGMTLRSWNRWILVSSGVMLLAASQGRGSLMALGAALLVLALWSEPVRMHPRRVAIRWTAALVGVFVGGAYIVLVDPTLNGRVPWWLDFLSMWREQPVFGVGTSQILAHQAERDALGIGGYSHCHNIVIDALTRYGIPGAATVLALLVLGTVVAVKRLRVDALPLALVLLIALVGMTEMMIRPTYWTDFLVVLTLAVLSAGVGSAEQLVKDNGPLEMRPS